MKILTAILLVFYGSNGFAISQSETCVLQVFSMGASESTPLQAEVERVLSFKGFNIKHRTSAEFNVTNLLNVEMFATANAGHSGQFPNVDCIVREFPDLGRFYSCRYELTLYFYSAISMAFEPMVEIKAATRDARSAAGFYQTIQDQLRELPMCINLIKR